LRRLLALLVLAVVAVAAYSYWKGRPVALPSASSETLDKVGDKLGQVGNKVGESLQGAKHTGSVKAALELNRNLAPLPINVDSENGVVVLKGEVPSEALRLQAEKVAAGVPDVAQVRNELRVNPALPAAPSGADRTLGENFDDRALEAKVRLAFSLNKDLKGTDIGVKSYRREVTLSGAVSGEAQKQLAVQLARETPDVLAVRDELNAGLPATGAAASAGAGAGARAQAAVRGHQSLAPYALDVREEGGQVVVSGSVKTAAERDLAGLVAKEAAGVAVQNKVAVRP
jgi:hyperosmotically inducible periplasmic protein